jgi:hypothetical protein
LNFLQVSCCCSAFVCLLAKTKHMFLFLC